jgi:hypothetical protein
MMPAASLASISLALLASKRAQRADSYLGFPGPDGVDHGLSQWLFAPFLPSSAGGPFSVLYGALVARSLL